MRGSGRIVDDGGGEYVVPSVKIGNMFWPSPNEMGKFIEGLNRETVLVSPSGPNVSYLAGAFRHGVTVEWANPAFLADKFGKGKKAAPGKLLELYQEEPEVF